jgi:dihydropteroate synthase
MGTEQVSFDQAGQPHAGRWPQPSASTLKLGPYSFDIARRPLIMGILNRTPDSFFDQGRYFSFDAFLRRADQLAREGADIFDVGGVKAGPGEPVSEEEELERVIPAIEALVERFEIPVSVDTWRAGVAKAAFEAGAVLGNDISGLADPAYAKAAAEAGAGVVVCHIRLAPRVPDPEPHYEDLVREVSSFLASKAASAVACGVDPRSIVVDAGLDLGKTPSQSLELLRASPRLASLGYPLLLSASNKRFLGDLLGLDISKRGPASLAAAALGIWWGCRILRVHDVRATRQAASVAEAVFNNQP